MLTLHTYPMSPNSIKVTSVLHHLGLDFEVRMVDLPKGENAKPEYLAINPNGMVPALTDGDLTLWESSAIMVYLAEKHGSDLMPSSPRERAEVNQWLCWQLCHWNLALGTITFERLAPNFFPGYQTDTAAVEKASTNLGRFAFVLNNHLADRDYIALDRLSLADLAIAASTVHRGPAQISLEEYPNIERWLSKIEALPAWEKATAPLRASV